MLWGAGRVAGWGGLSGGGFEANAAFGRDAWHAGCVCSCTGGTARTSTCAWVLFGPSTVMCFVPGQMGDSTVLLVDNKGQRGRQQHVSNEGKPTRHMHTVLTRLLHSTQQRHVITACKLYSLPPRARCILPVTGASITLQHTMLALKRKHSHQCKATSGSPAALLKPPTHQPLQALQPQPALWAWRPLLVVLLVLSVLLPALGLSSSLLWGSQCASTGLLGA